MRLTRGAVGLVSNGYVVRLYISRMATQASEGIAYVERTGLASAIMPAYPGLQEQAVWAKGIA